MGREVDVHTQKQTSPIFPCSRVIFTFTSVRMVSHDDQARLQRYKTWFLLLHPHLSLPLFPELIYKFSLIKSTTRSGKSPHNPCKSQRGTPFIFATKYRVFG